MGATVHGCMMFCAAYEMCKIIVDAVDPAHIWKTPLHPRLGRTVLKVWPLKLSCFKLHLTS